jgi:transposase
VFIRKLKSRKGTVYVQVVDKGSGKYKVLKSLGGSSDETEVSLLVRSAQQWIENHIGLQEFDFFKSDAIVEQLFDSITSVKRVGYDLLLGRIFDDIGFNKIKDKIFRELVLARVAFPRSKLKTTEFLRRYKQLDLDEDQIYRYLDKLHSSQKEIVQQISFNHTLKILNNQISIVFYDVTTLYFEIDQEDELRKTGFSKEGKHQNPQIVLGLLVSKNGYPLAYDVFEGNKFEGHTMLTVVDGFRKKHGLEKLIVIADSGLLSRANIDQLQAKGYEFILGARIKNETTTVKKKILALQLENGKSQVIKKGGLRLIVTYSDDRAKKDRYNRDKGVRKLEKQIRRGQLTKASINNRGYNKFLKLEGEISVTLDKEKLQQESRWDGLKGYMTNANLSKDQVIENYQHLWHIEKAFRIAKSDLKIRPVYHRMERRIEAHICISFVAYKLYKELERLLNERQAIISPAKAIEIAENIIEISLKMPQSGTTRKKTLLLTEEQKYLGSIFDFGC